MSCQSVIRIVKILRGSENSLKSVNSEESGFYHPFKFNIENTVLRTMRSDVIC